MFFSWLKPKIYEINNYHYFYKLISGTMKSWCALNFFFINRLAILQFNRDERRIKISSWAPVVNQFSNSKMWISLSLTCKLQGMKKFKNILLTLILYKTNT